MIGEVIDLLEECFAAFERTVKTFFGNLFLHLVIVYAGATFVKKLQTLVVMIPIVGLSLDNYNQVITNTSFLVFLILDIFHINGNDKSFRFQSNYELYWSISE